MIGILDDLGIVCTFFVIPCWSGLSSEVTDRFQEYLEIALSKGHELALHGYMHGERARAGFCFVSEFGCLFRIPYPSYAQQKERMMMGVKNFTDLTGQKPLGFRAPNYLHNMTTFHVLSQLGFRYDSSKTVYKPAYGTRLRVRAMRSLKPRKIGRVLEIPVTGDYTYGKQSIDLSMTQALGDFRLAKSHNGVFVLNNHPARARPSLEIMPCFLRALIAKIAQETDFVRLCDVERYM